MGSVATRGQLVKWFDELGIEDVPSVGGKNASLGEMYRGLASKGVKVPNGFAVTAEAYRVFLKDAKLDAVIQSILKDLDTHNLNNLRQCPAPKATGGSCTRGNSPFTSRGWM